MGLKQSQLPIMIIPDVYLIYKDENIRTNCFIEDEQE